MTIAVEGYTLGIAVTNAYLVADTETHNAILIDPVDDGDALVAWADELGWTIRLIVATHGHFDHILASARVKELTGAPFIVHQEAVPWLERLPDQGLRFTGHVFPAAATPDRLITSDDETITLDTITLKPLYTPGHAPGHIALYMPDQKIVFSGDALFQNSVGRTDLPGGDSHVLMRSIFDKLIPLGDDVQVLSGHGEATTIGIERRENPFLLTWQDRQ
ncbi:MAG: MBL fold metallo-hydrolase [Chloroflexota bacterium]|nr:MBL fold metallo-hydrolase [Chloroflexota bacterium]